MVTMLFSILTLLMMLGSWTLTMSVMLALVFMMSLNLYSPILSTKYSLYFVGGDNLSWSLVILTIWISALALMSSTYIRHVYSEYKSFLRLVISLAIVLTLAFTVTNFMLFYILFEAALIPITIIIIVWGSSPERIQAGLYLVIYTVTASLPLLISLLYIYYVKGTMFFYFQVGEVPPMMLFIMSLAFLVKFPLYGIHLWLPKAHVEAPVGGSMLLAALLLKLGPYGMMRLMGFVSNYFTLSSIFMTWGLVSGLAASIISVRQLDMKALVAYASISHMGLVLAGIMSYTSVGYSGAVIMLLGHGLASSGLFALVWFVYEWTKSRSLVVNRGLHHVAPGLSLFWFLLVATNMGVPPSLNMVGEVNMFAGLVAVAGDLPLIYGLLILFSALTMLYSLTLYTGLNHGEVSPHVNFLWQRPIYFTISFFHVAPLTMMFFMIPVLM